MPRADGRTPHDLRPLRASVGELDRADGSGRFAFGPVAALASFTGPIEVRIREERVERATLEVVHRPLEGVAGTPSHALISALDGVFSPLLALSAFPRALLQLVVQSLTPAYAPHPAPLAEDRGVSWPPAEFAEVSKPAPLGASTFAARAAAINAATLAALHAGSVGMRAVPFAVALASVDGELLLDPSADEEAAASARFGFAWAFGTGISSAAGAMELDGEEDEAELVWAEAEGEFSKDEVSWPYRQKQLTHQFDAARNLSRLAAAEVLAFAKEQLDAFFTR
ncbi:hypothetical protein VHUM_00835 [Vanrija humicola]|uniref:Exoribonuclease phosphorolytic domain-containing protein n=1 Tax=Vanrija humicola TaxID=5417 RepID=A0A7D8Z244_VANHU|nr:hypothetical protein VHUM_00835 [Vanrija humicola]